MLNLKSRCEVFQYQSFQQEVNMRMWNKIKLLYNSHFNQRITLDAHFDILLRIFYVFGFFDENNSYPRIIFSMFKFALIFFTIILGCIENLFNSFVDLQISFNLAPIIFRAMVLTSEFISTVVQQAKIRSMISDLAKTNVQNESINALCSKLIKVFRGVTSFTAILLAIVNGILRDEVQYIMPAIYNSLGKNYLIFTINLIHYIVIIQFVISLDLFPVFSILKLQAIVISLCAKIKHVTSGSKEENEKSLDECIELHADVIG